MKEPVKVVTLEQLEGREAIQKEADHAMREATSVEIVDPPSYALSAQRLKALKAVRDRVETFYRPLKDKAREMLDYLRGEERAVIGPIDMAVNEIERRALAYIQVEEEKRKSEELERRKKAVQEQEDRRLAEAEALEREGKKDEAAALLDAPLPPPPPPLESEIPKVAGVHVRESWHCEVLDLGLLVKSIAEGKCPANAVEPNMRVLNGMARSMREELGKLYPGIRAVKSSGLVASSNPRYRGQIGYGDV